MKLRHLAFAGVFILTLMLGLYSLRSNVSPAPDFPTRSISINDSEVIIEIPTGTTGSEIGKLLFSGGVIKSSESYFRIAVGNADSERVSPGSHRLTLKISAAQALEQLLDYNRIPNLVKVFEGQWKSEIVDSLLDYGFSKSEIVDAFSALILPSGFKDAEGLLFPAQYSFPKGITSTKVVQAMINRFRSEKAGQKLLSATGKYSPLELLTIASIVQAEGDTADFAKVSRVIHNRLEIGMPLQMDSTVHYIKRERGNIFLSTSSTLIDSPYNTYRHYGLPPSPIGSPGSAAIDAALEPSVGDWLYFITVAPGDTRFTSSNEEFVKWKFIYKENRRAGVFK